MHPVHFHKSNVIGNRFTMSHFKHKKASRNVANVCHTQILLVLYYLRSSDELIVVIGGQTCVDVQNCAPRQSLQMNLAGQNEISQINDRLLFKQNGLVILFIASHCASLQLWRVIKAILGCDVVCERVKLMFTISSWLCPSSAVVLFLLGLADWSYKAYR